jgi:hypothetical protein
MKSLVIGAITQLCSAVIVDVIGKGKGTAQFYIDRPE